MPRAQPIPAWMEQPPLVLGWLQEDTWSWTPCPRNTQQRGDADTHLHGPHQSVCWLRPKRALHFLGEAGSEDRSMRGAEWARQRHKEEEEHEEEKRQHHFSHFNTRLTDYNPIIFCYRMALAPPGKKWSLGKCQWPLLAAGGGLGNSFEKRGQLQGNSQLFKFLKSGKAVKSWRRCLTPVSASSPAPCPSGATTRLPVSSDCTERRGGSVAEAGWKQS